MISSSVRKKIDRHKVISFDIYDTLVQRNVKNPEDVFSIVENTYNKMYGKNEKKISHFKEKRILAYEQAYKKFKARCCIDDIYNELSDFSLTEKNRLKKIEIETECRICTVNSKVIGMFEYAKQSGKQTVLLSDMYLSIETIKRILEYCGIYDYDMLYVSCEYGKSKIDGHLYDICIKKMCITPKEMLHFGDGIKNDIIRARQKGIEVVWVRDRTILDYNNENCFRDFEKIQYEIQQAFIKNHIYLCDSETEKLGFEVFGPLVYGFCKWLHDEFTRNTIEKVFFLAREGLVFKNVYETLYPSDEIIGKYLYVSRKSLVTPTYWIKSDYESIIKSIAKSKKIDVETIIKRWGLNPRDCDKEIKSVGLERTTILDGNQLLFNERMKKIYTILKDRILENSKVQYETLKEYLKQEGLGGKCAIVDIGWNGGMHNAFEKIASIWEEPTEIHGYYIGINSSNLGIKLNNTNGFVYDSKKETNNRYYIYSFAGPLELSLTAPHDTTIGYKYNGAKIEAVLGTREYTNDDGSYKPELEYVKSVQRGIQKFVETWMKEGLDDFFDVYSEVSFRNCKMFGLMPKQKHIRIFEDFGSNDLGVYQHFASKKFKHLLGKNNIIKGFWMSTWKSGYMKRIFGLPLPYYKIYTFMRRRMN